MASILDACQFGGCNQFLIQIVSSIYPPLIIQQFTIRMEVIVMIPLLSLSIEQMEAAVLELEGGAGAFASSPSRAPGTVRIEMWSRDEEGRPKALVAKIAEYEPSRVEIREPLGNAALLLTPLEGGTAIAIQRGELAVPGPLELTGKVRRR